MKKYLRVYWQFIKINLSILSVYRLNLLNHVIESFVWAGFMLLSVYLLTARVSSIAGWDRSHLLLLASMYNLVIGIFYALFSSSFRHLAGDIFFGRLDMLLLKPVDSQFNVSLRQTNVSAFFRVLIGILMVALLLPATHATISFWSFTIFLIATAGSVVFLYSIWFIILTLLIWFPRLENLNDFLYTTSGLGKYPREVLAPFSGSMFVYLLIPFFLTVSVPTKQLLGEAGPLEVFLFCSGAIGVFFVSRIFWKYALRFYVGGSI